MEIIKLKLTNFRNHKSYEIAFDKKISLIFGTNGIGKTNILEAINLLSVTKSFRAKYDRDLIMHDKEFAKIAAEVIIDNENKSLELQIIQSSKFENSSSKKVKINNVTKTLSKFSENFATVIFSPENIDLITGGPAERRKYIDLVLFQTDAKYKKTVSAYTKAVRQRNRILELIRDSNTGRTQLPFWSDKIVELGTYIQEKRTELFEQYNSFIKQLHETKYTIDYLQNISSKERIEEYLDREIAAKTTLIGPHRDDFVVYQNSFEIAQFGSRGQQREAVFSIKLAEIAFLEKFFKEKPVLLLDDIFSELDDAHKHAVLKLIEDCQTIITTAENPDAIGIKYDSLILL